MLREPVFSLIVDPEHIVVLRILKEVKKEFSAQTGCWLHFIWVSRTVACYGIDGEAARDYLMQTCELVHRCSAAGGYQGYCVVEHNFDRKYKNLIKKYVDYVERESAAKMAIKRDDLLSGSLCVQFYGTQQQIDVALQVIRNEIFTRPEEEINNPGPFPATPLAPTETPRCAKDKGRRGNGRGAGAMNMFQGQMQQQQVGGRGRGGRRGGNNQALSPAQHFPYQYTQGIESLEMGMGMPISHIAQYQAGYGSAPQQQQQIEYQTLESDKKIPPEFTTDLNELKHMVKNEGGEQLIIGMLEKMTKLGISANDLHTYLSSFK
jgi:hypothetical protein